MSNIISQPVTTSWSDDILSYLFSIGFGGAKLLAPLLTCETAWLMQQSNLTLDTLLSEDSTKIEPWVRVLNQKFHSQYDQEDLISLFEDVILIKINQECK